MGETAATAKMNGVEKNQGDHEDVSIQIPPQFLCGVALSTYQNSGDPNTNWAWFENQNKINTNVQFRFALGAADDNDGLSSAHDGFVETRLENLGPSVIEKGYKIGKSSDFWNRYEEDIKLAHDLGSNSFRLTLEWSRIMPQEGVVDQSAIDRFHAMFDVMDRLNMESNVTLYWFTLPMWFTDKGGFEKEENIKYFVEFAQIAFKHFGKRSKLWSTVNEPGVAAMCGYIVGNHPPGRLAHFKQAGTVLCNILRGHKQVYDAIKKMPGGSTTAVGIVHNVFWLEPKGDGPLYAHVRAVLKLANRVWGNETVFDYLKHGTFESWVPFRRNVKYQEPDGKPGLDFIGVNHYARAIADWKLTPSTKGEGGDLSQMDYPVYPPSLYRSISYASTLGLPIYIMENGIPCPKDSPNRRKWIEGCLKQVENAIDDGFDVRGYMYWTLIDNFEWNFAWIPEFGLYEFVKTEDNPTGERRLKPGSEALREWYQNVGPTLTKKLKKYGAPFEPKSDAERQRLESSREREFLLSIGVAEKDLEHLTSQPEPAEHTMGGEKYKE